MVTVFAKWGHSIAVRIPLALAKDLGIKEGTPADISVRNGTLVVTPVATPAYDLATLVAGITDENRHGEITGHHAVGIEFA
jgi:antitoxin MazE